MNLPLGNETPVISRQGSVRAKPSNTPLRTGRKLGSSTTAIHISKLHRDGPEQRRRNAEAPLRSSSMILTSPSAHSQESTLHQACFLVSCMRERGGKVLGKVAVQKRIPTLARRSCQDPLPATETTLVSMAPSQSFRTKRGQTRLSIDMRSLYWLVFYGTNRRCARLEVSALWIWSLLGDDLETIPNHRLTSHSQR